MAKFNIQLTAKQQQYAAVGAVLVIVGGYFYYSMFWAPITKKINEDREEKAKVEQKIEAARREQKRLEVLERELQSLEFQAKDAEKRLPPTRDMPTVFETVAKLAKRYHVDLNTFAPGGVSTKTYFIEIPYQISITGTYHDVGRFLSAISVEERIYNISNVGYQQGVTDDKNKLAVTFTLLAYQYKG